MNRHAGLSHPGGVKEVRARGRENLSVEMHADATLIIILAQQQRLHYSSRLYVDRCRRLRWWIGSGPAAESNHRDCGGVGVQAAVVSSDVGSRRRRRRCRRRNRMQSYKGGSRAAHHHVYESHARGEGGKGMEIQDRMLRTRPRLGGGVQREQVLADWPWCERLAMVKHVARSLRAIAQE